MKSVTAIVKDVVKSSTLQSFKNLSQQKEAQITGLRRILVSATFAVRLIIQQNILVIYL